MQTALVATGDDALDVRGHAGPEDCLPSAGLRASHAVMSSVQAGQNILAKGGWDEDAWSFHDQTTVDGEL